MAKLKDLLDEIDTNLTVLDKDRTMQKPLSGSITHYGYKVVYLDADGLVKSDGFHIAVQNEGTQSEQAYFMERQPEWRREKPTKTDLTEQEVKDYIEANTNITPVKIQVSNSEDFATVTIFDEDSSSGKIVEKKYAVRRNGSDGFIAKELVPFNKKV